MLFVLFFLFSSLLNSQIQICLCTCTATLLLYLTLFFLTYCTNALAAPNDLTPVEQLDKYTDNWASSPAVMKIHIEHPQRSNGFCARLSTCCGLVFLVFVFVFSRSLL